MEDEHTKGPFRTPTLSGLLEYLETQTFRDLSKLERLGECIFFGNAAGNAKLFPDCEAEPLNEFGQAYVALGPKHGSNRKQEDVMQERDALARRIGLASGEQLDAVVLGMACAHVARRTRLFLEADIPRDPDPEKQYWAQVAYQMQQQYISEEAMNLLEMLRETDGLRLSEEALESLSTLKSFGELLASKAELARDGIPSDYGERLVKLAQAILMEAKEFASLTRRTKVRRAPPLDEKDDEDVQAYWRKISSGWKGAQFFRIMVVPEEMRNPEDPTVTVRQRLEKVAELLNRGERLLDAYVKGGQPPPSMGGYAREVFFEFYVDGRE